MTQYQVPRRRILSDQDLQLFQDSPAYTSLTDFIEQLNTAVVGKPNTASCTLSPAVQAILDLLDGLQRLIEAHPPVDNDKSRFGNPAFRDFYDAVQECAPRLHTAVPGLEPAAVEEVAGYLGESFGNRTRIDYGSGHELNFLCYLLCLQKLGVVGEQDSQALVLHVLWRYMALMRKIQQAYWLEPAGSHGVWGLDDYHFLPFLFGAAQLRNHKHLRPKSIHDADLLSMYKDEYMYFACIAFINSIKTASLRWHSPMLDDISSAKTWEKINLGMIKMYKAEVLAKLPIMQHFLFGSLIQAAEGMTPPAAVDEAGNEHIHNTWADCCGIKVPSAIAAKNADGSEQKIRRMDWG
ncbi:serine/threonine-protein phosphatase 2A activator 2 [Protomyces lactucae-debilis]|uniref:Serine/threonine-protein phosphatase 2A activator n=1 Tax=Protomyces lactucae-debilis TaxID=2754530 RepID=A0A1Y2F066_PROLT|nr:serine/threonine-protein phosphatase 2A activator 2 [Protomyces lactucae-debilis]ORY76365.1 serine/threonine-protein phosphatase 2A activator 2 [Protomyces lactucae-debilis]